MNTDSQGSRSALGIELTTSSLIAVRVDGTGTVGEPVTRAFEQETELLPQIVECLAAAEQDLGSFDAFGFAVPGLVDINTNRVVHSARFPEQAKTDLAEEILAATGKRVFLENDANAAAYGELKAGAGQGTQHLFYITAGTGIGGALILDGKLWHGVSGYAGEFGYFAVDPDGLRLEDVASANGIVRRAKNRLHQDPASSLFEIGEENITYEDVLKAANEEDGLAELILERTGLFLGAAVASVINLLNIEKIIIGGELMKAAQVVLRPIRERATELSFEPGYRAVEITAGSLGSNAGSIGAGLLSMEKTE